MRLTAVLPIFAILALGACNTADKPKSEDEVKDEMARMVKPRPGQYHSTSKLVSFEVPGMPAAQAERLKGMFSTAQGRDFCLTPAEADKGYEEMTKKLAQGNCAYDRFSVDDGALDAQLTCQTGKDMKAVVSMKGTVTAEGSQMTVSINQSAPGMPAGGVKMVAEVGSQRSGNCS